MKILLTLTILTLILACSIEPVNFKYHIQNPHPVPQGENK